MSRSNGLDSTFLRSLAAALDAEDQLGSRFMSKVQVTTDGCWMWLGARTPQGYGRVSYEGQVWGAHRLAYTLLVNEITPGYVLDHLCRTPPCVNPAHLEPVTRAVNTRRGDSPIGSSRRARLAVFKRFEEAR
jgi:hypothetical protein